MLCDSHCYASAVSSVQLFPTVINDAETGVLQLRKLLEGFIFCLQLLIAAWVQNPSLSCRVQLLRITCSNDDVHRPSDRPTVVYWVPAACVGPILRVPVHVTSGSLGSRALDRFSARFLCRFVLLVAIHVPPRCSPCLTTV